ncbi:MAG: acetyl-CoA carboxylase carboxyltransferase subunit alpha [Alphaproteobacteria bacterium]|nr:acetyl-CoA carboxylase carboxyltransferase subunit alpha [Alphaproteobacteria bacterium]
MRNYLDFEKPIAELEGSIRELEATANGSSGVNIAEEVGKLRAKAEQQIKLIYSKLTPWQKTQVARHPDRPHFGEYVAGLVEDFTPLAGDRAFADDKAIIGGLGRFRGRSVMVIGQEKGRGTEGRVRHNFGMARPEGYRKAIRLMEMADRFGIPVITLVDTPGAYPGIDAEARGQAEAIARGIDCCLSLKVPFVACIVGEGGSGGAVAIAAADRVLMYEHAIYSVASPEACAAILWSSPDKTQEAAEALKVTSKDLERLGVIDTIVPEPLGGAHRAPEEAIRTLGDAIEAAMAPLFAMEAGQLREQRRRRFLEMGRVIGA